MSAAKGGANARPIIIIKKKGGHAAHHGGAWKVAYADFVTAMMALFMVLWLVGQTDQEDREVISHYFRTGIWPEGGSSLMEMGDGIQPDSSSSMGDMDWKQVTAEQKELEKAKMAISAVVNAEPELRNLSKNIRVRTIDRGLLIEIVDGGPDALFDLSSADLKPSLVALLNSLAPVLSEMSNPLEFHGHTDGRPFPKGAMKDNWQLAFERAAAARMILQESGIDQARFAGVFAHGSSELFNEKDPMDAANRRIAVLAVRKARRVGPNITNAPEVTSKDLIAPAKPATPTPPPSAPAPPPQK